MIFRFLCSAFGLLLVVVVPPVTPGGGGQPGSGGSSSGEMCNGRMELGYRYDPNQESTYCPSYCCGSCSARQCCTYYANRLDQTPCKIENGNNDFVAIYVGGVCGGGLGMTLLIAVPLLCLRCYLIRKRLRAMGTTIGVIPMPVGGPSPFGASGQKPIVMGDPRGGRAVAPSSYGMGDPKLRGAGAPMPIGWGDPRGAGAGAPNPYGMGDPRLGGAGAPMPTAWGDPRATEMGGAIPMLGGASPTSYPVPRAYGQGPIYAGTS